MSTAKPVQAILTGSRARQALESGGFDGAMLAVVSHAAYIRTASAGLLWLASPNQPIHRRATLVSLPFDALRPGMAVTLSGSVLKVGARARVDWRHAPTWSPEPPARAAATAPQDLRQTALGLAADLARSAPSEGLAPVILSLPDMPAGLASVPAPFTSTLLRTAAPAIAAVIGAVREHNAAGVASAGRHLAGLGPGLTPSGDDFLGGLLFALRHLAELFPQDFRWDAEGAAGLLDFASSATNPISHCILSDLAAGEAPAPLHSLLDAILGSEPPPALRGLAAQVTRIGASSGWDLLAGFLTALIHAPAPQRLPALTPSPVLSAL